MSNSSLFLQNVALEKGTLWYGLQCLFFPALLSNCDPLHYTILTFALKPDWTTWRIWIKSSFFSFASCKCCSLCYMVLPSLLFLFNQESPIDTLQRWYREVSMMCSSSGRENILKALDVCCNSVLLVALAMFLCRSSFPTLSRHTRLEDPWRQELFLPISILIASIATLSKALYQSIC